MSYHCKFWSWKQSIYFEKWILQSIEIPFELRKLITCENQIIVAIKNFTEKLNKRSFIFICLRNSIPESRLRFTLNENNTFMGSKLYTQSEKNKRISKDFQHVSHLIKYNLITCGYRSSWSITWRPSVSYKK